MPNFKNVLMMSSCLLVLSISAHAGEPVPSSSEAKVDTIIGPACETAFDTDLAERKTAFEKIRASLKADATKQKKFDIEKRLGPSRLAQLRLLQATINQLSDEAQEEAKKDKVSAMSTQVAIADAIGRLNTYLEGTVSVLNKDFSLVNCFPATEWCNASKTSTFKISAGKIVAETRYYGEDDTNPTKQVTTSWSLDNLSKPESTTMRNYVYGELTDENAQDQAERAQSQSCKGYFARKKLAPTTAQSASSDRDSIKPLANGPAKSPAGAPPVTAPKAQ